MLTLSGRKDGIVNCHSAIVAVVLSALIAGPSECDAAGRPFTVKEEIGIAHFGDPYGLEADTVLFSPNHEFVAAYAERGRIDINRPEGELRFYRARDVREFLRDRLGTLSPAPIWALTQSSSTEGPVITQWRWLSDSSGIAFLQRGPHGSHRLVLADLKSTTIEPLTPDGGDVRAYDIRDAKHYVYALADGGVQQKARADRNAVAFVATGQDLVSLLFPADEHPELASLADRSDLWAVVDGKRFAVRDKDTGQGIVLFTVGQGQLALAPDGESLVTVLPVAEVPTAWETLYPPPYASSAYRVRAGAQDLATFSGSQLVGRYVRIDLDSGAVRWLSDGPTGEAAGWTVMARATWSRDGRVIMLPNAFVASRNQTAARACVAVVSVSPATISCVVPIEGPDEKGEYAENFHFIDQIRFADENGLRPVVDYFVGGMQGSAEYRRTAGGAWVKAQQTAGVHRAVSGRLEVSVKQGVNDPPVLVGADTKTKATRNIWDPNSQLKDIELGEATVYGWKDKGGRNWMGGLFKPVPYEPGHRYPLVIQTHGFSTTEFRPSGVFPTAFAARALAGAGVAVLQVNACPIAGTPEEGPCHVDGYETAVSQLVKEGLVDSDRIGIVGFSRTCFHVMEALTTSALHFKAASITDGVMMDYMQYLQSVDDFGNSVAKEYNEMMGAPPFGDGLRLWRMRSPLFNIDKVQAPLLVVAGEGRSTLLQMWGPYAALRYLKRPAELVVLNTEEHVQSNPAARLVSQGGSVDWFRFWLQDYEDPDPAKAEQYTRWRELRKLQVAQDAERANKGKEPSAVH